MKNNTYKLEVKCNNCSHIWLLEIEKGLYFVPKAGNSKYSQDPTTALSRYKDGYMWERTVECPVCETNDIEKSVAP